jgi:hypothetical protein
MLAAVKDGASTTTSARPERLASVVVASFTATEYVPAASKGGWVAWISVSLITVAVVAGVVPNSTCKEAGVNVENP